ncbi:3-oxoacyl-[acyl-carrier-protein] reductase FabG [Neolewinella maritima]|uniref:3-oxoacyl-[acyl-carrier-protein] reductase FabG n=1 Tax=Neolewinella maritima TaxID=1383882 RepID=A0ABM9AZ50_9BACT|nr:SDR family NAD(P)-dependent oxidoreductase [Neolewinella maritima]CAH0999959.1 3-oxoacyl-[acyl-carrier-protein] reductase FabG [Neolewinella maritima]
MKTAIVTGANRGLGNEVVRQLAAAGMRVILTSRSGDGASAVQGIQGAVLYHQLDVTDVSSIHELIAYVAAEIGTVDVLVNNAGIHYDTYQNTLTADFAIVEEAWQVNTLGPWRLTKALYPHLRKGGGGRVVNVSSASGSFVDSWAGTPAYAVSKAALNMLTVKMSHDLADANILVNAVCPGWVRTRMGGEDATRSVEEGAKSIVWAALLDNDGPTGGFYRDGEPMPW